ncbi:MAG: response regulator [Candidatus Sulfotelmatobacter sp.]
MARKILLADDSVTAQNMGRKILADAGYEVVTVNNGSAALKKIAELKPDLVILDVYMPGYSGLEVCQRLKESHESSRIPVLLTVGKLEPFKPEEAQRVRAEGYIVKPFEASELLSALSKLEDKVVPRSEPSKPGRFARAVAAAEEVENGWKSRISFPRAKPEATEKVSDDAAIYNPINRDLRTVVETPTELAAEAAAKEQKHQADKASETALDVAALVPAGMPKDVTPEEVAAIAAAAAQIQSASAKDESKIFAVVGSEENPAPQSRVSEDSASPAAPEMIQENKPEIKIESAPGGAPALEANQPHLNESQEKTQDLPVTMAAHAEAAIYANEAAPRWTAVSVALEGDEAAISLEQEMRKAYASFAAEVAASTVSEPETTSPSEISSSSVVAESHIAAISNPESQSLPRPEPVASPESLSAEPAAVASSQPAEPTNFPDAVSVPTQHSEPESASPLAEFTAATVSSVPEPVAELLNAIVETAVSNLASPAPQESQPAPEAEPAASETLASGDSPAPIQAQTGLPPSTEPHLEQNEDPETVKSTAAAWASWRQVRDSTDARMATAAPANPEFDVPAPPPAESAAMAVAAGAEHSAAEHVAQEDAAAALAAGNSTGNPSDIAGIVDSVLADLRPRLMEEISRKMSEKK